MLPHGHVEWGGGYFARIDEHACLHDHVLLVHMGIGGKSPEFSFAHALGQALHTRVPDVLDRFFENQQNIINTDGEFFEDELAEAFADCFALATLFGTPFDTHQEIPMENKRFTSQYMQRLVKSLGE